MPTISSNGTGGGNSNSTSTWAGGVVPTDTDDVNIVGGDTVTQDAVHTFNSLTVNGTFVASSSYSLTIDGETGAGRALDIVGTFTHGNGTITITTAADTLLRWPSSSEAYNITINHASCIARPTGDNKPVIANDLTITAGEFNTLEGGQNHGLTVTGKTTIGNASHSSEDQATLTCNASTISLGSGKTDGWAIEMLAGGTFAGGIGTHTTGAIKQTVANTKFTFTSGTTTINSEYTSEDRMFELTNGKAYNADGRITFTGNFTSCIQWTGPTGDTGPHNIRLNDANLTLKQRNTLNVEGYMNIDAGTFNTQYDGSDKNLTVTGDVSVTGTLTGNASEISLGSLTINSGGTYSATSGTTTITSESSAGNAILNSGTFTHNKGTVAIDTDATTQANEGPYYNFKTIRASLDFYPNGALDIQNNLDIVGDFDFQNNSHHLTVRGNMTVGDGSTTTRYGQQSANTNNLTVDGVLTILGSATADLGTHTTVNLGGIRNVGGTIN